MLLLLWRYFFISIFLLLISLSIFLFFVFVLLLFTFYFYFFSFFSFFSSRRHVAPLRNGLSVTSQQQQFRLYLSSILECTGRRRAAWFVEPARLTASALVSRCIDDRLALQCRGWNIFAGTWVPLVTLVAVIQWDDTLGLVPWMSASICRHCIQHRAEWRHLEADIIAHNVRQKIPRVDVSAS